VHCPARVIYRTARNIVASSIPAAAQARSQDERNPEAVCLPPDRAAAVLLAISINADHADHRRPRSDPKTCCAREVREIDHTKEEGATEDKNLKEHAPAPFRATFSSGQSMFPLEGLALIAHLADQFQMHCDRGVGTGGSGTLGVFDDGAIVSEGIVLLLNEGTESKADVSETLPSTMGASLPDIGPFLEAITG
jgi:hypothetical protein